jgi:ribose transport system permease protein
MNTTILQIAKGWKAYSKHAKTVALLFLVFIIIFIISNIRSSADTILIDLFNLLKQSAGLGIISIGQTLVILTGGIDLSLGSIITFVHVYAIGSMNNDPTMILPVCLTGMFIGAATGLFNGLGVAKAKIAPFIMTLCSDYILHGLYMIYTKGQPRGILADSFRMVGKIRVFGYIPIIVIVWVALSILFIFILKRTSFGIKVHMIGANARASHLSGINNDHVIIAVYILSGALASLASIILTMDMSAASLNLGVDYSMDSIASTVLGGTLFVGGIGGVEGTFVGSLIIRQITSLLQKANIVNWAKLIFQSIIIIGIVALYSRKKEH